jgi:hypothetical protein
MRRALRGPEAAAVGPPLHCYSRPLGVGVGSLGPGILLAVLRPPLHQFSIGLLYTSSASELLNRSVGLDLAQRPARDP